MKMLFKKIHVIYICIFFIQIFIITNIYAACVPTIKNNIPEKYHATYEVKDIIDGDTIITTDNKRIRFIGINTPEKAKSPQQKYGSDIDQPFSNEAKNKLSELINNQPIHLLFDGKKKDSYKRLLAHPFTAEGINISEVLLRTGHGFAVAIAPNLTFSDCYFTSEAHARDARLGVWSFSEFSPITATELNATKPKGFVFITDIVERLHSTRRGVWVDLHGDMAFLILHKNIHYFMNMSDWQSNNIQVRGWIIHRKKTKPWQKKWMMMVSHPNMVEII